MQLDGSASNTISLRSLQVACRALRVGATRLAANPRTVIWLASYPKSGNTWVRFLVCNLAFGLQQSAASLGQLAPDIHELGKELQPPAVPMLLKTHFPFSAAVPLAAYTAGAIYVVRHPADVMFSNYHYQRRSGRVVSGGGSNFQQYVEVFLARRGDPHWLGMGMGRWDEHLSSWLAPGLPFPILLLRYEDLLTDGAQAARRICSFLGLQRTAEEIAAAVAGSSFESMRAIEEMDIHNRSVGVFYKPYLQGSINAGLRFMRSGQSGEGEAQLSPESRRAIQTVFGPIMNAVGYPDGPVAVPQNLAQAAHR